MAAGITWLLNHLALLPFRKAKGAHWTERARLLWPARIAAKATLWLLPADLVLGQRLLWFGSVPPWPLAALAAWLGTVVATYPFDREIFPWLTLRAWAHQVLAGWSIRFTIWVVFFGIVALMPKEFDGRTWALACVFPVAFAVWVRGGLVWSCRMLRLLHPASDRLLAVATEVSEQMRVPFRGVWLFRSPGAVAFALPFTGDLLFSDRLLELHPDTEVAAICAHELGHLGESRLMLVGRLAGVLFYLPLLFIKPVACTWGPAGVLFLAGLSGFFIYCSRRLNLRLEKRADKIAKANEADEGAYARALARLHEENLVPAVLPRQRTHPDLYDRLLSAGVVPDYPRPEKPTAQTLRVFVFSVLLGVLMVANLERGSDAADDRRSSALRWEQITRPSYFCFFAPGRLI